MILDSGFCVLKGIVALKLNGVFASALITKHCYVYCDDIKAQQQDIDVDVGVIKRLPRELEGVKFEILYLKEPDYVMMLVSTYGSLSCKLN